MTVELLEGDKNNEIKIQECKMLSHVGCFVINTRNPAFFSNSPGHLHVLVLYNHSHQV